MVLDVILVFLGGVLVVLEVAGPQVGNGPYSAIFDMRTLEGPYKDLIRTL